MSLRSAARLNKIANQVTSSMNPFADVVVVSYARTPIGYFGGALASLSAPELGAIAIQGAMNKANDKVRGADIEEVIMGHVLSAGVGQAPSRQAALKAGLPSSVVCSSVNKVCASGMKAFAMGASQIALKQRGVVMVGGMESMSNVPFYSPATRFGARLGHAQLKDGLITDGLWDVYSDQHMGSCADITAKKFELTREQQDLYAHSTIEKAKKSIDVFSREIVPVKVGQNIINEDEQIKRAIPDKLPKLKAVFSPDGTVTAGNGSSLSDGAAAILLMSRSEAKAKGLKPIASVVGFADAERDPVDFTIAPAQAIQAVLDKTAINKDDIHRWELNEAFAAVILANQKLLALDDTKVNVLGGAIALGHPLGCSGARIICTLMTAMADLPHGALGCAAICNGGGGASAIIIKME